MEPRINCPVVVQNTMVTPQLGLFTVNISIMLTATDDFLSSTISFTAMVTMQSSSLIINATIDSGGSFLAIVINGSALNSIATPTTDFNVTVLANDGFSDSDPCIVAVSIEYLQPSECQIGDEVRTTIGQRQVNAIIIPVQQEASQVSGNAQYCYNDAYIIAKCLNKVEHPNNRNNRNIEQD